MEDMETATVRSSDMSEVMQKRWAVTWCMELLYRDIDGLKSDDLIALLDECEAMMTLAAPMPKPEEKRWYYALSSHSDAVRKSYEAALTEKYRAEFKGYRQTALKVIKRLKSMPQKKLEKKTVETAFMLQYRADKDGRLYMNLTSRDRFEYSFVYHLMSVLRDRRFTDVVQTCVNCKHYFLKLSAHRKECCSHRCSQMVSQRKRKARNRHAENRKNALYQLHHRAKRSGYSEEERARLLERNIQKNGYAPEMIPKSYRDLMQRHEKG